MIDNDKIVLHELQKLRFFLHGCHMATENIQSNESFHHACHLTDEIINFINTFPKNYIVRSD